MINTVRSQRYHLAVLEEGLPYCQAVVQLPQEFGSGFCRHSGKHTQSYASQCLPTVLLNGFHNCSTAFPETPPGATQMHSYALEWNKECQSSEDLIINQHPNFTNPETQSQRRKATCSSAPSSYLHSLFFYRCLVSCYFYHPMLLLTKRACQHIQATIIPSELESFAFCLFLYYFSWHLS